MELVVCVCVEIRGEGRGERRQRPGEEAWLSSGISRERARISRGAPRRVMTGLSWRSVLGRKFSKFRGFKGEVRKGGTGPSVQRPPPVPLMKKSPNPPFPFLPLSLFLNSPSFLLLLLFFWGGDLGGVSMYVTNEMKTL